MTDYITRRGLTKAQAQEVIATYQAGPAASWGQIRTAMTCRAMGLGWKPLTGRDR